MLIDVVVARHGPLIFDIHSGSTADSKFWGGKVSVNVFNLAMNPLRHSRRDVKGLSG